MLSGDDYKTICGYDWLNTDFGREHRSISKMTSTNHAITLARSDKIAFAFHFFVTLNAFNLLLMHDK